MTSTRDMVRPGTGRKAALCVAITVSAGVTVPFALRDSAMRGLEVLGLHVFFLVDVLLRPPFEGVGREDPKWVLWGKALMLSLVYLPVYVRAGSASALSLEALGLGVSIGGATLAIWGRACLGTMGTPVVGLPRAPSLYTGGPYRWIRHPIYAGFALAFAGHQLAGGFLPGLAVWVVFVASFLRQRIAVEEAMLVQQFGNVYREYRRTTWRMFPGFF